MVLVIIQAPILNPQPAMAIRTPSATLPSCQAQAARAKLRGGGKALRLTEDFKGTGSKRVL